MVLGPVAKALSSRRLLIVADGALQLIPFAALLDVQTGRALIERHEVEAVPSASVLAMLRRRQPPQATAGATVAVLADPVFTVHDARIRSEGSAAVASRSGELERSLEDTGLRSLDPLPATRDEAASIASHAGADRTFTALGFQASRAVALGPDVAHARIVHLASHALTDARRPELSGIVLSLYDEKGQPQDGFLGMEDIYRLRLSADLVVLSACRTGLGKEVRGEGVLGLTRGFLLAGTARVVSSAWKVSDRATAALMDRFYASLLEQHQAPGAALREAQLSLRKERRFSSPFAWAGFVLHGDWAPMQDVTGAARDDAQHLVQDSATSRGR
jgi:CHAT domain-containing protein